MKFYFPWRRYRNRPAIATPLSDVVDAPRLAPRQLAERWILLTPGLEWSRTSSFSFHRLSPPHRIDQIYRGRVVNRDRIPLALLYDPFFHFTIRFRL